MTDRIAEAARLARRLETRAPYKSAIQIAVDMIGDPDATVILGQGDYPTARQVADQATELMNEAAAMIRALTHSDSAGQDRPPSTSQPGEAVYDEPPARPDDPCQTKYVRADLHDALAARVIEQEARIARLTEALALLTDRSAGLVFAHHHGNGLEGWYEVVSGVDRAITTARAALGYGQ